MSRLVKTSFIAILFIVSLHTSAKGQKPFIDSIHSMLIELDSSIQYPPINHLLYQSIPLCTGEQMNDSLRAGISKLISEDYILLTGLRQPVSPHLVTKYIPFIQRLTWYLIETGKEDEYADNMMRSAIVTLRSASERSNFSLFSEARKILVQIHHTGKVPAANLYYYLGQTYTDAYKPDSSYISYILSFKENSNRTFDDSIQSARTLFSLANYCYTHNKRDSAFELFKQHVNLRKKIHGGNSSEYAYWMIVTADMYTYLAKYKLAQEMNFEALEITRNNAGEHSSQYALCMSDIGEVYYRTGEYDKALPYTQQSLDLKRKLFGVEYFDNIVNLHNLATLYTRMGLYNEAIPLLKESLAISKKYFGERMVYSVDLHPLAEVYEYLGEYDKALPIYQQSIQIHKQLQREEGGDGRNVFYPRVLHSIASLYIKLGQFDRAIEYYKQALSIKKDMFTELNPEYTKTLNAYAEAFMLKGDYDKALSLQLKSLTLAKRLFGEIHPDVAAGLYNLSVLYYRQNNLAKSETVCNQAMKMKVRINGGAHADVAECLDLLGNINLQRKRHSSSLKYYEQSYVIRKSIMTATHPGYIKSLYNLGVMYNKNGFIQKGEQLLMKADSSALLHIEQSYISLSEEEKLIFLHNTESQFQYLPSLLYLRKTNNPEIANRVYNDALVLKSMVLFHQQQMYNRIRKGNDSAVLQMYNHWRFNKAFLGQQLLLPPGKRHVNFDSLQDATTLMEEQLSRISETFRINRLPGGTEIKGVSQQLAKDAAAIEFIRFRLYNNSWTDSIIYAAVIMLPGKTNAVFVPLCEESELKKLLRFSDNKGEAAVSYLYPAGGTETAITKELYRIVWQQLQPSLKGIRTVYYSPAGLLYRLSFAAIHTGDGKLLADKFNLVQMVCTRNISGDSSSNNFNTAALWGDIDYDFGSKQEGKWKALPGTKRETGNIYSLLKDKSIACNQESKNKATEELFKTMDGNSPSLLHIATHGFFLPRTPTQLNPMLRNGLLLAGSNVSWSGNANSAIKEDGILTAYEISHLDLSNTKLVTLSACQTAMGDIEENEGVFGLQRAFKMAGVKQVLMSLWQVPDKETSELMTGFYKSLLKGNDANKSLRTAQLAMKAKYPPYYWAAFVVTE